MRTKFICLTLMLVFLSSSSAKAQKGQDIAEGLLRALIESQLDKSRRRNNSSPPLAVRPNAVISPQMRTLRPITANLARESAQLANFIRVDARQNVQARRLLPDAIRLQAKAAALQQRIASANDHQLLANDFRTFNADWSTLSHQLNQCPNLSANTRGSLQRLAGFDQQYCAVYGIQEQFDTRELTRRAYSLATYVNDLVFDAQQIRRTDAAHRRFVRNLGRYKEAIEYFTSLVTQNAPFSTVVDKYQDSYQIWRQLETSLSQYSTLNYASRRIQQANRSVHQLLRLQIGADRNHLLQIVRKIDDNATALVRSVSLEQLMVLPDASYIPSVADEFAGNVANLKDLLARNQTIEDIGEAWVYADEAWQQMQYYLEPLRDTRTTSLQRFIANDMLALKQELGVTVNYDRNALVKAASALEFQVDHLGDVIQRWHRRPGQHDGNLTARVKTLSDGFQRLEVSFSRGQQGAVSRRDCDQLIAQWQQVRPLLKACDTPERQELDYIVGRITPEIIRLRTMLD